MQSKQFRSLLMVALAGVVARARATEAISNCPALLHAHLSGIAVRPTRSRDRNPDYQNSIAHLRANGPNLDFELGLDTDAPSPPNPECHYSSLPSEATVASARIYPGVAAGANGDANQSQIMLSVQFALSDSRYSFYGTVLSVDREHLNIYDDAGDHRKRLFTLLSENLAEPARVGEMTYQIEVPLPH